MKAKTNYFLLGLFVIAGTIAVVAGILSVGASTFASRGLVVESYFTESVTGLEKGAIVRFRGVRIGVVTDIKLVSQLYPTTEAYAAVRCLLDPTDVGLTVDELADRLALRVREGYRVRLASQGLTGTLYLETDLVEDPALLATKLPIDWTPAHSYVPSIPSRIARIGSSVEEVLAKLERTDFEGIVAEGRDTLTTLRTAVGHLDTELGGLSASARGAVDDARGQVAATAEHAEALLTKVSGLLDVIDAPTLRRTLDALAAFADGLPATRERLDAAITAATDAVADLRGGVRGTSREVDLILAELRRASIHLAGLTQTLERYPSLLLIGNPPRRTEPGK